MDAEDLSDLERRLASWKPAADGLDPGRMLYAAGRAAAPSVCQRAIVTGLVMLVVALAGWVAVERAERQALADQLKKIVPVAAPTQFRRRPVSPGGTSPATVEQPADFPGGHRLLDENMPADTVLASHRLVEQGLDALLVNP